MGPKPDTSDWHVAHAHGVCRGNPGLMGVGAVVYGPGGDVVAEVSRSAGHGTNNVAEYLAVAAAVRTAIAVGAVGLELRINSELVVRQLEGEYAVKNPGLRPLHARLRELLRGLADVRVVNVPREENVAADRLANYALDGVPAAGINTGPTGR